MSIATAKSRMLRVKPGLEWAVDDVQLDIAIGKFFRQRSGRLALIVARNPINTPRRPWLGIVFGNYDDPEEVPWGDPEHGCAETWTESGLCGGTHARARDLVEEVNSTDASRLIEQINEQRPSWEKDGWLNEPNSPL